MNLEKISLKNKNILLISGGLLTLIIVIITIIIVNSSNNNNEIINNKREIVNNSFLTLMIEQEDGTYLESTSNTWPGEGYIFNSELSACQNGGELDYDSNTNKVILYNNKSDGCYIYFDIYTKPVINSINLVETTNNSITINISTTTGTNPITNYYYIINNNTPISTTSNSHTFSGLDSGTTYNIEVYVIDSLGYESNRATLSVETENATLLADYIKGLYTSQGSNDLYYHNSSLANGAEDNSYRYSGANPNNYICFGSDASTCPDDNLYRIIGVFGDQVKLIKADYANSNLLGTDGTYNSRNIFNASDYNTYKGNLETINVYYWNNSTNNNTWNQSNLNEINLNSTFLNTFSSIYRKKIADAIWYVNGYNTGSATPTTWHDAESAGTTWTGKIGIMYVSDYGFAASPSYWTTNMSSYSSARDNNWMFMGLNEWTISRNSSITHYVYYVNTNGYVYDNGIVFMGSFAVRPCFYLTSDVTYAGGTGTESDPLRLS